MCVTSLLLVAAAPTVPQPYNTLSDDERLIQSAFKMQLLYKFVEGLHDHSYRFWSHDVQKWLQVQSTTLKMG